MLFFLCSLFPFFYSPDFFLFFFIFFFILVLSSRNREINIFNLALDKMSNIMYTRVVRVRRATARKRGRKRRNENENENV